MKRILVAALAATLMTGSVLAEAGDRDRGRYSRNDRSWDRDHGRHHDRGHHRHRHVRYDVHVHHHGRYHAGPYHRPPGFQRHAWRPGARLPAAYYAPRYVVRDYRAYRLYAPPQGYHWVRVDRDVVLAAIATGAVLAVVNDLFY